MDTFAKLTRRRAQILDEITALGPMRRGTVNEQLLPCRRADGSVGRRGPYLTYTFKQGGKTSGKHLRNPEEADLYQSQIANFRRFQELSAELVQVSQTLADAEAAGDEGGKKNSRR